MMRRRRDFHLTLRELVKTTGLLRKAGDRLFKDYGLTQSQFNVLMVLKDDAPRGCSQSDLSRLMLVNRADMSGLVRRMLKGGLIERTDTPDDARAWTVTMSQKGKALLQRVEPVYDRIVSSVAGSYTIREVRQYSDFLKRTQEGIHKHAL